MSLSPDDQIDHIVKLMLAGEWKGARSREELAPLWDCHERTVGDRAVAAAAVCRRLGGPVEDLVRAKLAELEYVAKTAMAMQRPVVVSQGGQNGSAVELYPAPDVKAARQAIRDYLEVLGAFNHTKRTQDVAPDEWAKLSGAERMAKLREALAEEEAELATNGQQNGVH